MSCSCVLCSRIKLPPPRIGESGGGGVGGGINVPSANANDLNPNRGLNKAEKLANKRNEAIKDEVIPRLNPPFPYRVIPPPLEYFRFPANPPETLVESS
jgi:hypothetical protein